MEHGESRQLKLPLVVFPLLSQDTLVYTHPTRFYEYSTTDC